MRIAEAGFDSRRARIPTDTTRKQIVEEIYDPASLFTEFIFQARRTGRKDHCKDGALAGAASKK